MEFRIEKTIGAILMLGFAAWGDSLSVQVRHEHFRKGAMGQIEIGESSISFKEAGKNSSHSWEWKYENIQQLTLNPTELRILTYDDQKWQLGRDREYAFDQLPPDFASQACSLLRGRLDQRFVAHLDDPDVKPLWQIGAKLAHRLSGSQGRLLVSEDRIVFKTEDGESHAWRYTDVENVSTSGPFDLSITTLERSGWHHGSVTDYHFQLKQVLTEDRYNDLWRRINHAKGSGWLSAGLIDHTRGWVSQPETGTRPPTAPWPRSVLKRRLASPAGGNARAIHRSC